MDYEPSKRQRLLATKLSDDERAWLLVDTTLSTLFWCDHGMAGSTSMLRYAAVLEWLIGNCEPRASGASNEATERLKNLLSSNLPEGKFQKIQESWDRERVHYMKACDILRRALGEIRVLAEEERQNWNPAE